jgi:acyl-CoA thioester hydrolase
MKGFDSRQAGADQAQTPPPFRHLLRVRYAECDSQKVVFNARYGDFIAVTYNEFIRAISISDSAGERRPPWVNEVQLVRQSTEWRGSARFDDVVEISVSTVALGTTSFTLRYEFRIFGDAAVFARSETIYVCVAEGVEGYRKCPPTPQFRAALERGAPGRYSDHAGAAGRIELSQ